MGHPRAQLPSDNVYHFTVITLGNSKLYEAAWFGCELEYRERQVPDTHPRWQDDDRFHPHESPLVMTVPMMVLAVGSAFLGLILGQYFANGLWLFIDHFAATRGNQIFWI